MNWQDKGSVKKGNIGESLVDAYLKRRGYIPYKPDADRAHPFDRLCATPDKRTVFIAECKSKPARKFFPDTGIDRRHFDDYQLLADKYRLDVFLFFVDEDARQIYGGLLSRLSQIREVKHNGKTLIYPIQRNGIVYFPLCAMTSICPISADSAGELKKHSTRNVAYHDSVTK
jgi:hypothetical protein